MKQFRNKRSLGQNFFTNERLAQKIIQDEVLNETCETVLEIGPGEGAFTNWIFETDGCKSPEVILIEKDNLLVDHLKQKYSTANIINEDFLILDLSTILSPNKKVICFGSLPYNVSKPIIRKCLENIHYFQKLVFIIQKEVADKYLMTNKKGSLLGYTAEIVADCKLIRKLPPSFFKPQPKVESSLISFIPKKQQPYIRDREGFIEFLKTIFAKPNKTLKNNLYQSSLNHLNIETNLLMKRAHELSFEDLVTLYNKTS